VAALAAAGVAAGGGSALLAATDDESGDPPLADDTMGTLVAAAEVLYPSGVDDIETFVTRYIQPRAAADSERAAAIADSVAYLDTYTKAWYETAFVSLSPPDRSEALNRMGADAADPDPAGSDVERVRYYVVNELLFALYSSPTGGELVGLENPRGHAGGLSSYQRGPQS
jgi:hypothetical protein